MAENMAQNRPPIPENIELDPLFDTSFDARIKRFIRKLLDTRYLLVAFLLHLLILAIFGGKVIFEAYERVNLKANVSSGDNKSDNSPPPPMQMEQQVEVKTEVPKEHTTLTKLATTKLSESFVVEAPLVTQSLSVGMSDPLSTGKGGGGGKGIGLASINFFGISGTANNVVFITDISRSMREGMEIGHSFKEVINQMEKSLAPMGTGNGFNIIAFSRVAYLYKPGLSKATDSEKTRAIAWITRFNPEKPSETDADKQFNYQKPNEVGSTRAHLALEKAFEQKPDLIFFLSDGVPSYSSPGALLEEIQRLQKVAGTKIPINAVFYKTGVTASENDKAKEFMKQLSKQSGGKFIPIE